MSLKMELIDCTNAITALVQRKARRDIDVSQFKAETKKLYHVVKKLAGGNCVYLWKMAATVGLVDKRRHGELVSGLDDNQFGPFCHMVAYKWGERDAHQQPNKSLREMAKYAEEFRSSSLRAAQHAALAHVLAYYATLNYYFQLLSMADLNELAATPLEGSHRGSSSEPNGASDVQHSDQTDEKDENVEKDEKDESEESKDEVKSDDPSEEGPAAKDISTDIEVAEGRMHGRPGSGKESNGAADGENEIAELQEDFGRQVQVSTSALPNQG
eukprot:m.177037 g.177037  ORF g.177037 m.177037 type:complete len:271 (-) comp16568_c2_seq1:84-896(-)